MSINLRPPVVGQLPGQRAPSSRRLMITASVPGLRSSAPPIGSIVSDVTTGPLVKWQDHFGSLVGLLPFDRQKTFLPFSSLKLVFQS